MVFRSIQSLVMNSTEFQQGLYTYINAIHPCSRETLLELTERFTLFEARKGQLLTSKGDVENYMYFVLDGFQRVYYSDGNNKEATLYISSPLKLTGVADSFLLQTPSQYFLECITKSRFFRIRYDALNQLCTTNREIELLRTKLLVKTISSSLERITELHCFSSKERVKSFCSKSPRLVFTVPHKYVANYLSIDPTNYSKIWNSELL